MHKIYQNVKLLFREMKLQQEIKRQPSVQCID